MMFSKIKKLILITLTIILLTACSVKREDLYTLSFDGLDITVGYDNEVIIQDRDDIDEYTSLYNKKEEYILQEITIYVDDIDSEIYLDGHSLDRNISDICNELQGQIKSNNGNVCVLSKKVNNKNNVVMLYGDILDDNPDKIDRIEVSYK